MNSTKFQRFHGVKFDEVQTRCTILLWDWFRIFVKLQVTHLKLGFGLIVLTIFNKIMTVCMLWCRSQMYNLPLQKLWTDQRYNKESITKIYFGTLIVWGVMFCHMEASAPCILKYIVDIFWDIERIEAKKSHGHLHVLHAHKVASWNKWFIVWCVK
jgi:hypothetical protein